MNKKDIAGKYILIVATGIAATLLASPVYAQTTPPAPAAPAAAAPAAEPKTPAEYKAAEAKRFNEDKKKILSRMDDFIAKMQQKRTCVRDSANRDTMKACLAPMAQAAAPESKGGNEKTDPNASGSAPAAPPAAK